MASRTTTTVFKRCSRLHFGRKFSDSSEMKLSKFARCPERVFSGIQPTGVPHLGNYVGAIRNWVQMQDKYSSIILSIVDLHSITISQEPGILRENIQNMAACLIACGIDPDRTILFQQSMVPQHTELSWILGCLCSLPRLSGLPQWKEKSEKTKDPSIGLYTYPILQAADILLYKSTTIPVGEDQVTHLELARDLAKTFNRIYGVIFPKCMPLIGNLKRVKSLRNPASKMSKSDANPMSRIDLNDTADLVLEKVNKSVTDSVSHRVTYDPDNRPGIANLMDIHCSFTDLKPNEIVEQFSDLNTVAYKAKVADVINETIQPISAAMKKLLNEQEYLDKILKAGAEKASEIAEKTITEVRTLVGLR